MSDREWNPHPTSWCLNQPIWKICAFVKLDHHETPRIGLKITNNFELPAVWPPVLSLPQGCHIFFQIPGSFPYGAWWWHYGPQNKRRTLSCWGGGRWNSGWLMVLAQNQPILVSITIVVSSKSIIGSMPPWYDDSWLRKMKLKNPTQTPPPVCRKGYQETVFAGELGRVFMRPGDETEVFFSTQIIEGKNRFHLQWKGWKFR